MLFTVADENWEPGSDLSASGTRVGLYRTRAGAEAVAAGRRLLAVTPSGSDPARGRLVPARPPGPEVPGGMVGPGGRRARRRGDVARGDPPALLRALGPPRAPPPRGPPLPLRDRAIGDRGRGRPGLIAPPQRRKPPWTDGEPTATSPSSRLCSSALWKRLGLPRATGVLWSRTGGGRPA